MTNDNLFWAFDSGKGNSLSRMRIRLHDKLTCPTELCKTYRDMKNSIDCEAMGVGGVVYGS